jgi:hypothetical protein
MVALSPTDLMPEAVLPLVSILPLFLIMAELPCEVMPSAPLPLVAMIPLLLMLALTSNEKIP